MIKHLALLYQYRELLWMWTKREVAVRYKQSFLGAAWAIVQPLALMIAFTVLSTFLRGGIATDGIPRPVFYYAALLPWTFFSSSLNQGGPSLISNLQLVTKTYFPREILPLAKVGVGLFDFAIASTILAAMMLVYRLPIPLTVLWLPVLVVLQVLLTGGLTLLLSSVIVLYRDVRFVIPLALQVLLFLSPIIYSTNAVPEAIRTFFMLNPISPLIDSYRRVLLYNQNPDPLYLGLLALFSVLSMWGGYVTFKRLEVTFADII